MYVEEDPTLMKKFDTEISDKDIESALPFPKFVNITEPIY